MDASIRPRRGKRQSIGLPLKRIVGKEENHERKKVMRVMSEEKDESYM